MRDYYDYPDYPEYPEYPEEKTGGGWVFLILGTMFLLGSLYPYLKLDTALTEANRNYLAVLKGSYLVVALFAGLVLVWLIFTIVSNIRFSKRKRVWGRSFGIFLGRFFILAEYAAFVLLIVFWFI